MEECLNTNEQEMDACFFKDAARTEKIKGSSLLIATG